MTFKDVMEGYQKTVEAYLQTLFAEDAPQKQLFDAMRYSLLAGGKRIRPILVLEFCRICGGDAEKALPFAAAIHRRSERFSPVRFNTVENSVENVKNLLKRVYVCI